MSQFESDDYYTVLGLQKNTADDAAIKKAYRKLAVKWHPVSKPKKWLHSFLYSPIKSPAFIGQKPRQRGAGRGDFQENWRGILGAVGPAEKTDLRPVWQRRFGGRQWGRWSWGRVRRIVGLLLGIRRWTWRFTLQLQRGR